MADVRKGDMVHYVNEDNTGGAKGHHLAGVVVKLVGGEPLAVNLLALFELGGQNPVADHMHLLKVATPYDLERQEGGTWHLRDECLLGE